MKVRKKMTKSKIYKWFYHSSAKNETSKAVQAALDNNCGLLVLVCKPSCAVCAKACSKDYIDVDGKLQKYMEKNWIVGLKIDDSQSHVQSIISGLSSYYNYDKKKPSKNVPLLLLVKPKEGTTVFETLKKKSSIDEFFGGFSAKKMAEQTYENVSAWLDKMHDPSLEYFDGRENYSTAYGFIYPEKEEEEVPQKPVEEETYKGTVEVTCSMSKEVAAKSEAEARKLAEKEINAWIPTLPALAMPDGWKDGDNKTDITVKQL